MTIAVIIPTYNRIELTQNCLASIQRHDPVDEIIIIDNGSTDGSERLATAFTSTAAFLSCLCGSEQFLEQVKKILGFLSCLCGSERQPPKD